jgi:hypothetical protein
MGADSETEGVDLFAGLHPIFRECVDIHTTKVVVDRPFIQGDIRGDFVYCTNGRMLVRTPVSAVGEGRAAAIRAAIPADRRIITRDGIFAMFALGPWDADPIAIPDGLDETSPCPECKGTGKILTMAEHNQDWECEDCDGSGRWDNHDPNRFPGRYYIASCYLARLARHGASIHLPVSRLSTAPALFTIGELVDGLVMPMDADRVEEGEWRFAGTGVARA